MIRKLNLDFKDLSQEIIYQEDIPNGMDNLKEIKEYFEIRFHKEIERIEIYFE